MSITKKQDEVRKSAMIKYSHSGRFQSSGEWIHPAFYLDTYEIIFVVKGMVYIREDNNEYVLSEGDVLLLDPHKPHEGYKTSSDVDFYWIHFRSDEKFEFKKFTPKDAYDISLLCKRVLQVTNTPGYPVTSADASVRMLTDALEFQNQNSLSGTENELLYSIYEYVRQNANFFTTVQSVADHFGYSTGYISKLFCSKYGMGLKEYINGEQIKRAKNMLLNTQFSVNKISREMQFPDSRSFIKFFTYHEGISPTKYRNIYVKR